MTRADMQARSAQAFDRLDANSDGKIDQADREARHAAMFDRIDSDRNGQISRAEFLAHKPMHGGGWRRHGGDGHGGASTGEGLSQGMGMRRRGGHGMGRMILRMADSNSDGSVTRDEFSAASTRHFDHMDANKDGQVTSEERRAMRQSMRQRMHDRGSHDMGGPGASVPPGN